MGSMQLWVCFTVPAAMCTRGLKVAESEDSTVLYKKHPGRQRFMHEHAPQHSTEMGREFVQPLLTHWTKHTVQSTTNFSSISLSLSQPKVATWHKPSCTQTVLKDANKFCPCPWGAQTLRNVLQYHPYILFNHGLHTKRFFGLVTHWKCWCDIPFKASFFFVAGLPVNSNPATKNKLALDSTLPRITDFNSSSQYLYRGSDLHTAANTCTVFRKHNVFRPLFIAKLF